MDMLVAWLKLGDLYTAKTAAKDAIKKIKIKKRKKKKMPRKSLTVLGSARAVCLEAWAHEVEDWNSRPTTCVVGEKTQNTKIISQKSGWRCFFFSLKPYFLFTNKKKKKKQI